jgi:protein required for attachment to host cells
MLLLKNNGDAAYPSLDVIAHRTIENPPNREQLSDAPGLSFSSHGPWRNTEQKADPHQEREDSFAIESAAALASAVGVHGSEVIVVAPPGTLKVLRRHYDRGIKQKLKAEITKDLTKHPVSEIARLICSN